MTQSNENWMADIAAYIGNRKLREVVLPGTHDSGTYSITPDSPLTPEKDIPEWVKIISKIPLLGDYVDKIIANWSRAQGDNTTSQLEAGIRYLDLRVCARDGNMYISHSMYGDNIFKITNAVHAFANNHQKEIIILDFNHFYEMTPDLHNKLLTDPDNGLINRFGNLLVPCAKGIDVTVNDLWQNGQRVIAFYDDPNSVDKHPQLWSQDSIRSYPPDSHDIHDLKTKLEVEVNKTHDTFWVLQGLLTPDASLIEKYLNIKDPFHLHLDASLKDVAKDVSPKVVDWVQNEWAGKKLNIVILDWFNLTDLVDVVKSININS